jgi:hypothetical protein
MEQDGRLDMLLKWRDQISHELADTKERYRLLSEDISQKEIQLRNIEALLESQGWTNKNKETQAIRVGLSVVDSAYKVIQEIGTPMYYRELAAMMKDRGLVIPGTDPAANLLTHMTRDERFDRIARGTYALREWHLAKLTRRATSRRRKSASKGKSKRAVKGKV